ncbi:hypothetical protein CC85DRAFT_185377 [Cutaneotrichosporon oleaginosum]|uniref:Uncharacterized protein n=1 Tax=Cutaneotrichosporon oleaginosum TaxID=879819 RepID=A0A0J0XEX6_9TREE|nr:uncharacterized protein CC85DRAFT_185377 [Cutaneotrichosporon oleaginosum]KLT39603.1 hypothetical protein CC85DRAFT_185377 [Cutaneotrichosporon oleaginosum]TXT15469.1 hypothetical protein COLE_01662 [Cutaneotrichosporon oleaginosum]
MWRRWRSFGACTSQHVNNDILASLSFSLSLFYLLATMTRPLNGHRGTESASSSRPPANQDVDYLSARPLLPHSSSDGRIDLVHDRSRTANHINRRSGGFYALANGFSHDSDIEYRATWAGSDHTWQQGGLASQSQQRDHQDHGRVDTRANRLRDAQLQSLAPPAPRSRIHIHTRHRTPADAPLTDEAAFRTNVSASVTQAPSAKPLPLPFSHGMMFTVDALLDDSEEVLEETAFASTARISARHQYQLPAFGSFGDFQIQNHHLFTFPDSNVTPKGSPTDSCTPTPTATTFAESHRRNLNDELRKLHPAAQRHAAQAVVNANALTKEMLSGTEELLDLLSKLRKEPSSPRVTTSLQQTSPSVSTYIPPVQRPSSVHSVTATGVSRSASVRTIRNMIQQMPSSRRATMLSTITIPHSDDSDDGDATTDGTTTGTDGSHTTGTDSSPSSPEQRPKVRYSEERALGSLLELIEQRGTTQPQIDALRRLMPLPPAGSRQSTGPRRSFPHRAHTKVRRTHKKRRSKRDKDREQGLPRLPSASGSESDGLGWDMWEDVGKDDLNDFVNEIMDVAQWYNLHEEVV